MTRALSVPAMLVAFGLAVGGLALPTGPGVAEGIQVAQADVVKKRDDLMGEIGSNTKKLNAAAKAGQAGEAEVTAAREIQAAVKTFLTLFPEGTGSDKVSNTRAKPEIWQDWARFEAAGMNLAEKAAAVEMAAAKGDAGAMADAFKAMGNSCGGCHKPFRGPKP